MSTRGPQTTSVGGGKEQIGRGEGGGAGMSFFEDFSDGAANLTLRFFLSFFGGGDFFLVSLGAAATRSSSGSGSSKQEMPKHSIITAVCCVGHRCRGDGVGLPASRPA